MAGYIEREAPEKLAGDLKENIRTAGEIEQLIRAGKDMPKGMSLPEQWFYEAMRFLYRNARYGMEEDEARRERAELIRGYESAAHRFKFEQWRDGLWNRIDVAARKYREKPSKVVLAQLAAESGEAAQSARLKIEAADEFYKAVYGI